MTVKYTINDHWNVMHNTQVKVSHRDGPFQNHFLQSI